MGKARQYYCTMSGGSVDNTTKDCRNKRGVESDEMMVTFGIQKSVSTNKSKTVYNDTVQPHTVDAIQKMNMCLDGYSSTSESNDSFMFLDEQLDGNCPIGPSTRGVRRNLFFEFEASLNEASCITRGHAETVNLQGVEDDTPGDFFATFFNSLTTEEKDDVMRGFESYILEHHPEIPND